MRDVAKDTRPILIVPYMWIGDFVRCHSVVTLLRQRFPNRPIDLLATTLCAPLADYMPGVRQSIVADLPRGRLAPALYSVIPVTFLSDRLLMINTRVGRLPVKAILDTGSQRTLANAALLAALGGARRDAPPNSQTSVIDAYSAQVKVFKARTAK